MWPTRKLPNTNETESNPAAKPRLKRVSVRRCKVNLSSSALRLSLVRRSDCGKDAKKDISTMSGVLAQVAKAVPCSAAPPSSGSAKCNVRRKRCAACRGQLRPARRPAEALVWGGFRLAGILRILFFVSRDVLLETLELVGEGNVPSFGRQGLSL